MAILYQYEDKKLKKFVQSSVLINSVLSEYGIKVVNSEFTDIDSYILEISKNFNFIDYDIFTTRTAIVEVSPHYHKTDEARTVIKGEGRFYFEFGDILIEVNVSPGDFILIPALTKHYFKCLESMVVIRFYSSKSDLRIKVEE